MIKTYNELIQIPTFEERLNYLKIYGKVGEETFGFDRYLNQKFYRSQEWNRIRRLAIMRDNGCDLGCEGYDILTPKSIIVHHINPITIDDIKYSDEKLLDLNNVITTSDWTHKDIHYGYENKIKAVLERTPNDTCPWKG